MRRTLALTLLALAACGPAADESGVPPGTLERAFTAASNEYRVPVQLLQGIAWVETRFLMHPGEAAIDGGYGPLHLGDLDGSLPLAMELTGLSREQLTTDVTANVRGGAAVLRHLADRVFAGYPALREEELSDWYDVVTRRTGWEDLRLAEDYANRVFYAIEHGVSRELPNGDEVVLHPVPVRLDRKRAFGETLQFNGSDGYPGVVWSAANAGNYSQGRAGHSIRYVVIHTVQGSYAGAISWFRNPSANVSAHYVISNRGDITQMVHHADTGWHAGNSTYNKESIGLEHEGFVSDPGWATQAMYDASGALTRWLCDTYGIPKDRTRIIGHVEVPGANHTDPGPHWNWGTYMGIVQNGAAAPSTGTLRGVVYVDPDTGHRIPGARVSLSNGLSTTADGNGAFRFDVDPGDYTVEASADGYVRGSVSRHVDAGQETWGSVGLRPATPTGVYRGTVFELRADDPCRADPDVACDMSTRLDGATVTLSDGGRTVSFVSGMSNDQTESVGGGRIWVEVPAGRWTATAQKAGFGTNAATREIVAGQETWGSIGLLRDGATDETPPVVTLEAPVDGATITDLAEVAVRGSVADAALPSSVTVNDAEVPLVAGRFETTLRLAAGANVVTVVARDAAGNVGEARATVTYAPPAGGVDGFVFHAPDEAARVAGVLVELGQEGAIVASAETGADGSFHLDVPGGDYVASVTAPGYQPHHETITVPEGGRLAVKWGLYPGGELEHFLEITSPASGAALGGDEVLVAGFTSVYGGTLTVNGVPATIGAEGGRDRSGFSFSATVPLVAGENVVEAVLVKDGLELRHAITVTRLDGLGGNGAAASTAAGDAGGCASAGGTPASLLALAAVALALGRRRSRG